MIQSGLDSLDASRQTLGKRRGVQALLLEFNPIQAPIPLEASVQKLQTLVARGNYSLVCQIFVRAPFTPAPGADSSDPRAAACRRVPFDDLPSFAAYLTQGGFFRDLLLVRGDVLSELTANVRVTAT